MIWELASGSDHRALAVLDGTGRVDLLTEPVAIAGPHYSRRTPGSVTFTGVGQEVVLVSRCGRAVWACIYQRTPQPRGTTGVETPFVFRNNVFHNLGAGLSSELIREALCMTKDVWTQRYGAWPGTRLRTEVDVRLVQSRNPGYCYQMAGWERGELRRHKLLWWAP